MKIVHLCLGNFFINGYSYQENLLAKHHALMGHDVTVIASTFAYDRDGKDCYVSPGICYENGCKIIRIPYKSGPLYKIWRTLRVFDGLTILLEQERPDIIFSHNVQYLDAYKVVNYIRKHSDVKLYADNHADYINSARNFLSKWIKHRCLWKLTSNALCDKAEKCYGVTPMRCEFLKKMYGLPNAKVEFLPLGIDDTIIPHDRDKIKRETRDKFGIPEDSFVICHGGKIDKLKNTHHLLSAIKKIDNSKLHVIIFGLVTPEMVDTLAIYKNLQNIHFVGWCNAEQVVNVMIASDLCVFPGTHSTLWEESIGLGIPGVFKDWGEGFSHIHANNNSALVDGNDENQLCATIKSLIFTDKYETLKRNTEEYSHKFHYSDIAKKAITR